MANKKLSTEEVVKRFKDVHGDVYDYSEFVYINKRTKGIIICRKHGCFFQSPHVHIYGGGCPICGKNRQRKALTKIKCGVGIYDVDNIDQINPMIEKAKTIWRSMIFRCYDKNFIKENPTYKDCKVCDEWLTFSNFLDWFTHSNYKDGFELDKDILSGKCIKIYSPQTCCFVPHAINGVLCTCKAMRKKDLPIGVRCNSDGTYSAEMRKKIKGVSLGIFNTIEEAFNAYKQAKEQYIQELAQEYYDKGDIPQNVYNALMNYKVEITD